MSITLGVSVLVLGVVLAAAAIFGVFYFRGKPRTQLTMLYGLFLAAYPLGQAFRNLEWGLDVMRYNLADIGFPVYVAMVFSHKDTFSLLKNAADTSSATWSLRVRSYRAMRIFAVIGIVLSVAWECLAWFVNQRADGPIPVGTFDPNDIAAYFIGGGAAIWIRTSQIRISSAMLDKVSKLEQEARAQERRAIRSQRKKKRKR